MKRLRLVSPGGPPEGEVGRPAGHGLVVLRTCADNVEAALLRSLLEANGIPCVVQGEQHRSMLGVLGAYIEVRVLVPTQALERAVALLEDPQGAAADEEAEGEPAVEILILHPDGPEALEGLLREERAARRRRLFGWVAIAILAGPAALGALLSLLRSCGG